MFGNNINNPFMISNMYGPSMMNSSIPMMGNSMMRSVPTMAGARSSGLLNSLFGGRGTLSQGLRSFNFGSLLNNASKALGVVKDAIPIVKEVGPMMGNMRQMLKIASIFKDETDTTNTRTTNSANNISVKKNTTEIKENDTNIISTTTNQNNNEPNFFL